MMSAINKILLIIIKLIKALVYIRENTMLWLCQPKQFRYVSLNAYIVIVDVIIVTVNLRTVVPLKSIITIVVLGSWIN